jgi:hypothetical protein
MAAIHHFHHPHRLRLSSAHGEDELNSFLTDNRFDVESAAEPNGLSARGFSNIYQGPCVRIGALTDEAYPRPGVRADVTAIRAGLHGLLELADCSSLSVDELQAAGSVCLCQAAEAQDGEWLRRILVEEHSDHADDRHRQLTCLLLFDALHDQPSTNATVAFRDRWAFGPLEGDAGAEERAMVAALWRAAALRNFSVGAWRALWRWLAAALIAEPMTAQQLGERLADALDDVTVAAMLNGLPERMDGASVLPAETELASFPWSPMRAVRELALGAQRLRDLEGPALKAFVGTDPHDLGP